MPNYVLTQGTAVRLRRMLNSIDLTLGVTF